VTPQQRTLRISFSNPQDFEREYSANLLSGGAFIPTEEDFELREKVSVHLSLDFCDQSLLLCGEVVHRIDPVMASAGATAGVAVQLLGSAAELRSQLEPLVNASGSFQSEPLDLGERDYQRVTARVKAQINGGEFSVTGYSRNLSQSGVLVDVLGQAIPVGLRVNVTLHHPVNGETRDLPGEVVRQIVSAGEVAAVGIRFDPAVPDASNLHRFIEDVQHAEHSRNLGGIHGSLSALAPPALLSMFGSAASEGTLTLRRHTEEQGVIGFMGGLFCYAQLGAVSGMKALIRLLEWKEGTFEFHTHLDRKESMSKAIPLQAVILDAVRRIDEGAEVDPNRFPLNARLILASAADELDSPSKVESAVIDLVRAGFTVERILEIIPESDPEIYCAMGSLLEQGAILLP